MATKKKDIYYLAASTDGMLGVQINTDGTAIGYVDGAAVTISKKAAQALASRWMSPESKNRLIRQGFLPATAAQRTRLARLPVEVSEDGEITVGTRAANGLVTVFGEPVFALAGALNTYWTPWGQMKLLAGAAKVVKKVADEQTEKFRGDLREAAEYAIRATKEAAAGAAMGGFIGVAIGLSILWLVVGGGAVTTGAAAATAASRYRRK